MERKVVAIYLLTGRRAGAKAFYEKLGFSRNDDMIIMGKDLVFDELSDAPSTLVVNNGD